MTSDGKTLRGLGWLRSLRVKAIALLIVVAVVPAGVVAYLLTDANRGAVETAERSLQAAVLEEVASGTQRSVERARDDAYAVAGALTIAAGQEGAPSSGESAVRSVLASRSNLSAIRFEVPAAKVDLVVRKSGSDASEIPRSTPALRAAADERGMGFAVTESRAAVLVVPVAPVEGSGGKAGYVVTRLDLGALVDQLDTSATTRFESQRVKLIVADSSRHLVAGYGMSDARPGDDVSKLPVWNSLPEGTPSTARMAVVTSHVEDGVPMLGGVETLPELGWAVAVWRPEVEAYQALTALRKRTAAVVAGALALALLLGLVAAGRVTGPVLRIAREVRLIGQRRWSEVQLDTSRTDELGQLGRSVERMARDLESGEEEIEKQAKLRGDLGRFLDRELVDKIVKGEHSLALGGKRAEVTVLFADVVAFTPLAESRPAEEVVGLLNELFSLLTEIVFRHGGTVDKFIGDCIMAIWGAPVAQPDHAERALAAAEDMMRFLETANDEWRDKYGVEIRLAIGVNSGDAIVGNIGSAKRMEYTVVGDVVNVAARLEAIAAPNQLLVGQATKERVGDSFTLASLGERNLTGRKATTSVYQLDTEL